jgi:AcrR family transcriptional regulator
MPSRRPPLTRDAIVAAALRLVDDHGSPDALTMRALARDLGVDPMAVYRHVADKHDLLGAMCDALIAGLTPLDPDGPWEPQIRRLSDELRGALEARPALVPVLLRAPATPAAVVLAHDGVALLHRGAGLTEPDAVRAFGALFSLLLGGVLFAAAGPPPGDPDDLRDAARSRLGDAPHLDAALELLAAPPEGELDVVLAGIHALAR